MFQHVKANLALTNSIKFVVIVSASAQCTNKCLTYTSYTNNVAINVINFVIVSLI